MLVDITRLETGDIPRDIRVFPVSLLLEELRKQHTLPATEKNLSFRVNNCDRHVRSDYNLLRLILQNLISNAIRYTDSGTIEVNCIARDDMLRIAVTDTGIGIPDTERQMIFEEFYQIDNPARERGRGMGMGLAIVRRLAALLDHPLHLQSVPGEGSTFAIEVPLENATGATRGTPAVPVIRTVAVTGTILLVDDDPTVLQSLQMLLESMGFRVYTAENAAAAVQLVSSHEQSPDLIISDYRLPDSASGTTLVRELRDASGRHIPAIILTGDITLTGLEDSFTNSMLLGKPVLSVDLEQAIQRLLGKDSKPGTPD
jgi:two-component system CheB/CheR fusion protein